MLQVKINFEELGVYEMNQECFHNTKHSMSKV